MHPVEIAGRAGRVHGGTDSLGAAAHDFSTNSNACGPHQATIAAVAVADAGRYPDASYTQLRSALAAFHEVDVDRIVLAASASEFIFRITAVAARLPGARVSIPARSYGDYAQAAMAHGLGVTTVMRNASLRWCCDPSSPLGANVSSGEFDDFTQTGGDCIVVLDRAYEPLRLTGRSELTDANRVWQLWTPNKALGLTGVRAAYAIAPVGAAEVTEALERLCPSWPIGAHGVAMLLSWDTGDVQSWLERSRDQLREWKERQLSICSAMNWQCTPGDANFFCAAPPLPTGMAMTTLLAGLRSFGIKLRDATSFGLPGQCRLSVQPPESQDALHNAWKHIMNNHSAA